jgi:hypothetical protein
MALNIPFLKVSTPVTGVPAPAPANKPIQDFIAQVKGSGLARTNRYAVIFAPPARIQPAGLNKILLFCDQVQIPGANYSTVQNRVFGEFREIPYEKLYDQISLSFYVDTEMAVKNLFDEWHNLISNTNNKTFGYYNDYITDMFIEVQDLNDKTRYAVRLMECYPKTVSSIQLDMNSKEVMKINVGFQYKYWTKSQIAPLANGEIIPTNWYDKVNKNFTGFQETLNKTLGTTAGDFLTGAAGNFVVTKLPSILKF